MAVMVSELFKNNFFEIETKVISSLNEILSQFLVIIWKLRVREGSLELTPNSYSFKSTQYNILHISL
jgi:hypothetical protein